MGKKRKSRRVRQDVYKDSYDNRESKGAGGSRYIDASKVKNFFKIDDEGRFSINILPYEIKTSNHPMVKRKKAEISEFDYKLDFWAHRYIGAGHKNSVICLDRTYGKACPICEERARLFEEKRDKEAKELTPQHRVMYNIQPVGKGTSGEVFVWEDSFSYFEKELIEEAHECGNGKDLVDFSADDENGKIIKFRATEEKFNGNSYYTYKSFSFLERDEELDEDLFDDVVSLDELLVVKSYEEVEQIFMGMDDEEEEDQDDDSDDEQEEEEKPKKNKRKKEVVEDDEEEEEEQEKPKKKKSKKECPENGTFGKDFEKFDECEDCKYWEECMEASDK